MSTYAIGDVQGCYDPLMRLLDKIKFDSEKDHLWFAGDLVNRGPQSLATLRFIKGLGTQATSVLGNHDLTLLAVHANVLPPKKAESLQDILKADDCEELLTWLKNQPVLHYDPQLEFVMVHAGIPPQWDLAAALSYSAELEQVLRSDQVNTFLENMYGDSPILWQDNLVGWERLRYITNAFTRMRFCTPEGALDLKVKGSSDTPPEGFLPWFKIPARLHKKHRILFGHWAALQGNVDEPNVFALDTGCVWGNCLTAVRLEDTERFEVSCEENKKA